MQRKSIVGYSSTLVHLYSQQWLFTFSFLSVPKRSQDLPKPSVVKHSTNGFDTEQKTSSTPIRTVTTTTAVASSPLMTRSDTPKIASSLSSQPISRSTEGRSPASDNPSNFVNLRSQNIVKNESHGTKRVSETFRASGQMPEPSRVKSSRDGRQQTRESDVDVLETLPSFDYQPQSQEVMQSEKVTFRCQGESSERLGYVNSCMQVSASTPDGIRILP